MSEERPDHRSARSRCGSGFHICTQHQHHDSESDRRDNLKALWHRERGSRHFLGMDLEQSDCSTVRLGPASGGQIRSADPVRPARRLPARRRPAAHPNAAAPTRQPSRAPPCPPFVRRVLPRPACRPFCPVPPPPAMPRHAQPRPASPGRHGPRLPRPIQPAPRCPTPPRPAAPRLPYSARPRRSGARGAGQGRPGGRSGGARQGGRNGTGRGGPARPSLLALTDPSRTPHPAPS